MLLVTHNLGVVADICDPSSVMQEGLVVERRASPSSSPPPRTRTPASARWAYDPTDAAAAALLAPTRRRRGRADASPPPDARPIGGRDDLLEVRDLVVEYPGRGWRAPSFRALHEVSMRIEAGETVGLVGESGSGKTTLGRAVLGLAPVHRGHGPVRRAARSPGGPARPGARCAARSRSSSRTRTRR